MDAMRVLLSAFGVVVRACLCLFVSALITFVSPISDPLVTWLLYLSVITVVLAIRSLRRPLLAWIVGQQERDPLRPQVSSSDSTLKTTTSAPVPGGVAAEEAAGPSPSSAQ
jgi:hypothetical protein